MDLSLARTMRSYTSVSPDTYRPIAFEGIKSEKRSLNLIEHKIRNCLKSSIIVVKIDLAMDGLR